MQEPTSDFVLTHPTLPNNPQKQKGFNTELNVVNSPALFYNISAEAPQTATEPISCLQCKALLNLYCTFSAERCGFTCCFCNSFSKLTSAKLDSLYDYLEATDGQYNSLNSEKIEHVSSLQPSPPIYFFVIDTCTFDDERFKSYVDSIKHCLESLPEDCLVGLITFGTNIEIFSFNSQVTRNTSYLISGNKEYKKNDLKNILDTKNLNSILVKKSEINKEIFDLKEDSFKTLNGRRKVRCTGSAISLCNSLLGIMKQECKNILLFLQGPCTYGPGAVSSLDLKKVIRSGEDVLKGNCQYTKPCEKFYNEISEQMTENNVGVSIFGFTMADFGLYEMRSMIEKTGGAVVVPKDFNEEELKLSIEKFFRTEINNERFYNKEGLEIDLGENSYTQKLNCKTQVFCSKNIKITRSTMSGYTNTEYINNLAINFNNSLCFEIEQKAFQEENFYFQFVTKYQTLNNQTITRVSNYCGQLNENYLEFLNPEALLVYLMRRFVVKIELEEDFDLIRRIDKSLVRTLRKTATYSDFSPDSIEMGNNMSIYPKLVYFLRRNSIVCTSANSPDETTVLRLSALTNPISNIIRTLMPKLYNISYEGCLEEVELDERSLSPEYYLVLDAFNNVLLWRGKNLNSWYDQGYHETEEYSFLANMDDLAVNLSHVLIRERFPTPKLTYTTQGESQERYLISVVNPSGGGINSEYIDFEKYFECVKKLIADEGD